MTGLPLDRLFGRPYITIRLYNYSVIMNATAPQLDATFSALADPTRRAIVARLARGEATVMELAQPFDMSQPAISKHIKVLENAGLISRGRDAQRRPCRLEPQLLADASGWLDHYRETWERTFQRLDALLEEMKAAERKRTSRTKRKPKH
jgi:DNA-binding transcriptional ArsR family regulator